MKQPPINKTEIKKVDEWLDYRRSEIPLHIKPITLGIWLCLKCDDFIRFDELEQHIHDFEQEES